MELLLIWGKAYSVFLVAICSFSLNYFSNFTESACIFKKWVLPWAVNKSSITAPLIAGRGLKRLRSPYLYYDLYNVISTAILGILYMPETRSLCFRYGFLLIRFRLDTLASLESLFCSSLKCMFWLSYFLPLVFLNEYWQFKKQTGNLYAGMLNPGFSSLWWTGEIQVYFFTYLCF